MRKSYFDLSLVSVGFAVRLAISPFTRDPWGDTNDWLSFGSAIFHGQNPYVLSPHTLAYPPLWAFFCVPAYVLWSASNNPFVFNVAIKLPIIITDILISVILRHSVYDLTHDPIKSRAAMLLYLFNPVTIIFSSFWGMFDAIPTLFVFISILLLSQRKYLVSGLSLGIGIAVKGFFPALLLPLMLFYVWKKEMSLRRCFNYVLYSASIPILISVPFLMLNSAAYFGALFSPAQRLPINLTYWLPLRYFFQVINIPSATVITLSFSIATIGFLTLYSFLLSRKASKWQMGQNPNDKKFYFKGLIMVILAFYITANVVNEQYLIWILPFLIIYTTVFDQTLRPFLLAVCSLNLFFVLLHIGPSFFFWITGMPAWWTAFLNSPLFLPLIAIVGSGFSAVCIMLFRKLLK
jgi:Gpi18-like mannosyltransferase